MHAFTDNHGRTWTLSINVHAIKRVRALLDIDLYKVIDDGFKLLSEIVGDPVTLCDVLFVLCQDEAEKRNVTDEEFGRSLGGDALSHAADAFMEELVDFFPGERSRTVLREVIAKSRILQSRVADHAAKLVEQIDPDREAETFIASSTNSPG